MSPSALPHSPSAEPVAASPKARTSTRTAGRRRGFGHLRRLPSRRYQASYLGPDGDRHIAPTTFQTTRDIFLLAATTGATPVTGDVEIMQFFKNQITTDGDVSGLTPYKTIQGNAATVMADSWYQGGTAT